MSLDMNGLVHTLATPQEIPFYLVWTYCSCTVIIPEQYSDSVVIVGKMTRDAASSILLSHKMKVKFL